MEAFRVPTLKKQLEKVKNESEQSHLMTAHLADALEERNKQISVLETNISQLLDERNKQEVLLEEERAQFHSRITQMAEEHAKQIAKRNNNVYWLFEYKVIDLFVVKSQRMEMEQRLVAEQKILKEYQERETSFKEQLEAVINENDMLKDENSKMLSFCNDPNKSVQVSILIVYIIFLYCL